eukprot:1082125-Pleurochrysis_carterae.AAC.3
MASWSDGLLLPALSFLADDTLTRTICPTCSKARQSTLIRDILDGICSSRKHSTQGNELSLRPRIELHHEARGFCYDANRGSSPDESCPIRDDAAVPQSETQPCLRPRMRAVVNVAPATAEFWSDT